MAVAYGVTRYQIKGPDWLRTDWFDIVARYAGPASRQELMAMLQTLLADRFNLKIHREQAPMRAYALAELGLTLVARQMPMDVLVVDHAERTPTPN